jgi:nucleotide-binding universal stress UspA family protein
MFELNEILVPVDFSDASAAVFARARALVNGEKPVIILLRVVDPSFAELAQTNGLGTREEVLRRMRTRAELELNEMAAAAGPSVEISTVLSEGVPFYEIVQRAEEFDVDAVVIGKKGARDVNEALFFGSTAERVVRACKRPVIVLPLV